ncbi:MAG: hypothetical protein N2C14_14160 [Planctomycetales bacterium]
MGDRSRWAKSLRFALALGVAGVVAWAAAATLAPSVNFVPTVRAQDKPAAKNRQRLDPAAWGEDHVGQPVPEFMTGGECLFCHRKVVGPTWGDNPHATIFRRAGSDSAAMKALRESDAGEHAKTVEFLLGSGRQVRFLKRGPRYGQLELLSATWRPHPKQDKKSAAGKLEHPTKPRWDRTMFGESCAGCHATGIDAETAAFSVMGIDCFACHGDIRIEHAKKPGTALFSKRRKVPARTVISACGQCHARTGKSRSTGRPHANNFVAGDNLFRDLQADLSDAKLKTAAFGDRHILENIRDVALLGDSTLSCVSCHGVHKPSADKHQQLAWRRLCSVCHEENLELKPRPARVRNRVCGY